MFKVDRKFRNFKLQASLRQKNKQTKNIDIYIQLFTAWAVQTQQ